MDTWLDEKGNPTKRQLKEYRKQRWRGLVFQAGLDRELATFWTDEEKAIEVECWKEADKEYENRKAEAGIK